MSLLFCRQVFEKNPNIVKNFAVLIKYDSRTGTHAMYKEYRDVTVNGTPRSVFVGLSRDVDVKGMNKYFK